MASGLTCCRGKFADLAVLGDSCCTFLTLSDGLIHCLLERCCFCCALGPTGIGGPPSESAGFEGPVGGSLSPPTPCPAETGLSSASALGPVGGAFPVRDWISVGAAWRLGTEPKAGADGARGGGDTSLVDGGSCETRSGFGRMRSRSRFSLSLVSRSSRASLAVSGYLRSRSSCSRPHRLSCDRLRW